MTDPLLLQRTVVVLIFHKPPKQFVRPVNHQIRKILPILHQRFFKYPTSTVAPPMEQPDFPIT
jgi:hypothetical protein